MEKSDARKAVQTSSLRATKLLQRVMVSEATVTSALEVSKVSEALKKHVVSSHLRGESGLLQLLSELKMPESFQAERGIPQMIRSLAEQTALNLEAVISAAAVILSHSTADDVFTGACGIAIDLDPQNWTEEVNFERRVTLRFLRDKGPTEAFAEALESLRDQLPSKSLPLRAEILFRRVPIHIHPSIPSA